MKSSLCAVHSVAKRSPFCTTTVVRNGREPPPFPLAPPPRGREPPSSLRSNLVAAICGSSPLARALSRTTTAAKRPAAVYTAPFLPYPSSLFSKT
ncbi:hypothetical protein SESBI_45303 [Sesbania bispinosa]|nr:hypothetical protein SESBI_45303 [Sesbania bispinosa]